MEHRRTGNGRDNQGRKGDGTSLLHSRKKGTNDSGIHNETAAILFGRNTTRRCRVRLFNFGVLVDGEVGRANSQKPLSLQPRDTREKV